jgi:predicted metal-dependent hydrolase
MKFQLIPSNPQPSPRKQTTTIDKAISSPAKAPAKRPLKETTTNKPSKSFLRDREHLATTLLAAIDQTVMSGKLAAATISTGGLKLIWSTKLRTAAGRAHWTHVKRPLGGQEQHDLKIELSTRLITSEEKMRDTLAHELCHCATWVIDNNPNANHGKQFKEW